MTKVFQKVSLLHLWYRLLHEDDLTSATKNIEIPLSGDEPYALTSDILIIPVPDEIKEFEEDVKTLKETGLIMIIVSNTSPLSNLAKIDRLILL